MRYYLLNQGEVLAEIEAPTPFVATCAEQAEAAPRGTMLVDLESGCVFARVTDVAHGLVGWSFTDDALRTFGAIEADTDSRRSVA